MEATFLQAVSRRVLVLDGAIGSALQARDLPVSDYQNLENCGEVLNLTRPDVVRDLHRSFLEVGCDGVTTNSFSGSAAVLREFGLEDQCREINRAAASLAREVCDEFSRPDEPRFVIGSIGPGTRLPSLGQTNWDALIASHGPQLHGLLEGGADVINIETCQDVLQAKAALAAADQAMGDVGRIVPVCCSVTIETSGTMLVGTDIAAALAILEPFEQVRVIGLNCATGPKEMAEHVRYLGRSCDRHLLVQPNAGLPELRDGRAHYTLEPEELARWLAEFVETDGVGIVGGCCGTTPEHLRAVVERIGRRAPKERQPTFAPSVASLYQPVTLRQDTAVLAIGERTNANGSKRFRELLAADNFDAMVEMGTEQVEAGSHLLDVCTASVGRDEVRDMSEVISRFATGVTAPLVIDSTETNVLEAALKLVGGRCVINSINLESGEERLDTVCGLAKRYGAALVALTIDEEGMARTADEKLVVARRIFELVTGRHGLRPSDLIFDPLTFTICTGTPEDRRLALETLEGVRRIKAEMPGVYTVLGLSNVSFGLKPQVRQVLNSVFLHYARAEGLDAAILHAGGILPLFRIEDSQRVAAEDLIFDRRRDDYDPLETLISLFPTGAAVAKQPRPTPQAVEDRLKRRIIDGNRTGLEDDLDEALTTYPPLEIINDILLDGMKTVGDLFGAGQMQLPFVLKSAEAMKAAVRYLEPLMDRQDGQTRGKIVLATVRGDVHDIGKNLVDIILTNNGFTVYNLGIKQPISAIIDAFEEHEADAIGMSGLLVKSTVVMRENLGVLRDRGQCPPVILGGAALTRKYVEHDLRPEYPGSLHYAKDAFEGLLLMGRVMTEPAVSTVSTVATGQAPPFASLRSEPVPKAEPVPVPARSAIDRTVPIPVPPFWGARVATEFDLRAVLGYLNEHMLFQVQWQYRKSGRSPEEFEQQLTEHVRPICRELVDRCDRKRILQPQAVYGYWPVQADGDTLIVYDPAGLTDGRLPNGEGRVAEGRPGKVARFEFPRQRKAPFWCLSDFFRPVESGEFDVAAFSVVTAGRRVSEVTRELFNADRYTDYLHLHGLSVEAAEALAEYMHKQIRAELGIAGRDADDLQGIFKQRYQGSRYSFGYPACPRLEDQVKLWPLLKPDRIGVSLTEEFHLEPEHTTPGLSGHSPEAT